MVVLFCGIPGAGKTTIAGILAASLAARGRVRLLSSDRLRPPVYRKFFQALAPERKREDFLIFDATFFKKEWRRQVKALARGEKVVTVYLVCPLEVALKRNRERRANIAERAVHIMFHRMEPPRNPSLMIDTANTPAADAAAQIFDFIARLAPRENPIKTRVRKNKRNAILKKGG